MGRAFDLHLLLDCLSRSLLSMLCIWGMCGGVSTARAAPLGVPAEGNSLCPVIYVEEGRNGIPSISLSF